MPVPEARPISKIRRKSTFYFLSLSSGILMSIYVVLDDFVNLEFLSNPFIFGAFEMVVGSLASILLFLLLLIPIKKQQVGQTSLKLGYFIDPNFQKFKFPKGKIALYTLLAGLFSTGATILYYYLLQRSDASVMMPFSQFVLIYLLIGDSISEKEKPVMIEIQSIAMIAIGVIIASLSQTSTVEGSGNFLLNTFLILGPFSLLSALFIFFQKKALTTKDKEGKQFDSINLRMWTMFIITIGQTISALPFLFEKGEKTEGFIELTNNWRPALAPVIISMLLTFLSIVFYSRALTMGKMSIVRALRSISVVSALPITALASIWIPSLISSGSWTGTNIILKTSGSILILVGMIAISLSETRAILLANVKQGEKLEIEELTKIKGVENVSFITGTYDLLINIKMRSIGKTFSLVEKSIAKLSWIEDVITLQVMKEYY
ncbi:MAG: EamA family transporter [Candidatus Heimdallarchaeaceae archaeon]